MSNELKPCKCGKDKIFTETTNCGFFHGFGIGCLNVECDIAGNLIIGFGFTKKSAEKRAIKKWNRRVDNAT
jgi:hypothetical protein